LPDGTTTSDISLFQDDMATLGDVEGVNVHNMADMLEEQIRSAVNGTGMIIGGFCNSGVCLAKYW